MSFYFFFFSQSVLRLSRAYARQWHSDNQGRSGGTHCWGSGDVQRGSQHQFQLLALAQNSVHLQRRQGGSAAHCRHHHQNSLSFITMLRCCFIRRVQPSLPIHPEFWVVLAVFSDFFQSLHSFINDCGLTCFTCMWNKNTIYRLINFWTVRWLNLLLNSKFIDKCRFFLKS